MNLSRIFDLTFLFDRELGLVYLTDLLRRLGLSLVAVFVPVYLWNLGFGLPAIFTFFLLQSVYFVISSFALTALLRRGTDKIFIVTSLLLTILFFYCLQYLEYYSWLFFVLPLADALRRVFWASGFELDFTEAVDSGYTGRQESVRQIITSVSRALGPFIGGLITAAFGFGALFMAGSVMLLMAVLPALAIAPKSLSSRLSARELWRHVRNPAVRPYARAEAGYAAETLVSRVVWPIFIFLAVGSVQVFGGVVAFGFLVGGVFQFLVGYVVDSGRRNAAISVMTYLYALTWVLRSLIQFPVFITGSHVAGRLFLGLLIVPWLSLRYELAHQMYERGIFIFSRVVWYHMVRICFWLILIALALVLTQQQFFAAAFVLAALVSLLYLFTRKQPMDVRT